MQAESLDEGKERKGKERKGKKGKKGCFHVLQKNPKKKLKIKKNLKIKWFVLSIHPSVQRVQNERGFSHFVRSDQIRIDLAPFHSIQSTTHLSIYLSVCLLPCVALCCVVLRHEVYEACG